MLLTQLIPFAEKLDSIKTWFIAFGPLGAFLISLVDSFIPLPGGADLAVIVLSASRRHSLIGFPSRMLRMRFSYWATSPLWVGPSYV